MYEHLNEVTGLDHLSCNICPVMVEAVLLIWGFGLQSLGIVLQQCLKGS